MEGVCVCGGGRGGENVNLNKEILLGQTDIPAARAPPSDTGGGGGRRGGGGGGSLVREGPAFPSEFRGSLIPL